MSVPSATGATQRSLDHATPRHTAALAAAAQVGYLSPTSVPLFIALRQIWVVCPPIQWKIGLSMVGPACSTSRPSNTIRPYSAAAPTASASKKYVTRRDIGPAA